MPTGHVLHGTDLRHAGAHHVSVDLRSCAGRSVAGHRLWSVEEDDSTSRQSSTIVMGLRRPAKAAVSSAGSNVQSAIKPHEARVHRKNARAVIFIERLEDHDFIAGIDDGSSRTSSLRRRADGDFALGINGDSLPALKFSAMAVAQRFRAPVMAY